MLLAALLAGCAVIGREPVAGWPELTIVEHRVSAAQVRARCSKYAGPALLVLGCAEFHLAARRCDIWLIERLSPSFVVEHERLHCRGYDHAGETALRDLLDRHRDAALAQRSSGLPD
jgi:hypothetical protein